MSELYRSFQPDLEIRSTARGGDGRTVVGIAVPYGHPQRIDHELTEQFAMGSFAHQVDAGQRANNSYRVKFTRNHMSQGGTLIGKTMLLREDAAGLYGEWRVSATPTGDETLELLRDGVLTDLSIGFRSRQDRRLPGGVTERVKADLVEVSVVLEGAYGEAALVSAVRSSECSHCGSGTPRLDQLRQALASLPDLLPLP